MSKLTIIQLLNKIANGEEAPKKFKYDNLIFKKRWDNAYFDNEGDDFFNSLCIDFSNLNDEVEIIEEDKEIEKIKILNSGYGNDISSSGVAWDLITLKNKINEIIDYLMENKQ